MSDWNFLFSRVKKCNCLTFIAVAYILATKVRLHRMTFVACCNNPIKERICCLVAVFFAIHLVRQPHVPGVDSDVLQFTELTDGVAV